MQSKPSPEEILSAVALALDVPEDLIRSKNRTWNILSARYATLYYLRSIYPETSLRMKRMLLDYKEHTAVMNAYQAIDNFMTTQDVRFQEIIAKCAPHINRMYDNLKTE